VGTVPSKVARETVFMNVRVPKELYDALLEQARRDAYTSLSELVRDILREWVERNSLKR